MQDGSLRGLTLQKKSDDFENSAMYRYGEVKNRKRRLNSKQIQAGMKLESQYIS